MPEARTKDEHAVCITHIEYARTVLDERLGSLIAERDVLREDSYANAKITKRLAAFFKERGLYITKLQNSARSLEHYDLAKLIWRARDVLVAFRKRLMECHKATFEYDVASLSAADTNSIKNLCDVLTTKHWITYQRRDNCFQITPSLSSAHKAFLHGGWAEEVTLYLLDKALKKFTTKRHLKHKLFWDLKLRGIYPNSGKAVDMQLDLVAEVGDRFYIFETKSGEVLAIDKWVDRTRLFEDEKNRFITCTADENLKPRIFHPFRLFALPTFEEQFTRLLSVDFPTLEVP